MASGEPGAVHIFSDDDDYGVHQESWFASENIDGVFGPTINCQERAEIHHLNSVHALGKAVVIDGAYLNPANASSACDRVQAGDYSDEEKMQREMSPQLTKGRGFLRENEQHYLVARIRFDLPDQTPKVALTNLTSKPAE